MINAIRLVRFVLLSCDDLVEIYETRFIHVEFFLEFLDLVLDRDLSWLEDARHEKILAGSLPQDVSVRFFLLSRCCVLRVFLCLDVEIQSTS